MLIWTGRGWMVAVIAFACFLSSELISEAVMRDHSYYQRYGWPKLIGALVAAVVIWVLDRGKVFDQRGKVYIDKETGQEVKLAVRHTLFFIPVRYWPLVLAVLGVLLLFVGKE